MFHILINGTHTNGVLTISSKQNFFLCKFTHCEKRSSFRIHFFITYVTFYLGQYESFLKMSLLIC